MTTRYTPEKLEHHLSYEIDMLNGSYGLITDITEILENSNASDQQKIIALNAVKETFCLRARALVEFFTKPKTKINSASNFANTYVSNKAPPDIERKLNNQIAHFMEGRSDLDTDKISGFGSCNAFALDRNRAPPTMDAFAGYFGLSD